MFQHGTPFQWAATAAVLYVALVLWIRWCITPPDVRSGRRSHDERRPR